MKSGEQGVVANVAVELGKPPDRGLVDKHLRHGMHRLADGLGQLFLADVLGPHIHVSVALEHLGALQPFGELVGMDTEGATGTTVNHHEHETQLLNGFIANWRAISVHYPTPPALRAGSLGTAGLLPFLNLPQWLDNTTLWELGFARRMAPQAPRVITRNVADCLQCGAKQALRLIEC